MYHIFCPGARGNKPRTKIYKLGFIAPVTPHTVIPRDRRESRDLSTDLTVKVTKVRRFFDFAGKFFELSCFAQNDMLIGSRTINRKFERTKNGRAP